MLDRIKAFFKKLQRKVIFFLVPFLVVFALLVRGEVQKKPVYQAKARVKVENTFGIHPTDNEILADAFDQLKMPEDKRSPAALEALKETLSIVQDRESGIMEISMVGTGPHQLKKIVNGIAKSYVTAINNKAKGIEQEQVQLKTSEAEAYRRKLEEQLANAKSDLENYESKIEEFRVQKEEGQQVINGMKAELAELEYERSELLRFFTSYHPDVIRIDLEIDELKKKIKTLPSEATGRLTFERELADRQKLYTGIKEELNALNIKRAEEQVKNTKEKTTFILSPAKIPAPSPKARTKRERLFTDFMIALVIGASTIIGAVILDKTLFTPEELYAFTKLPIAGVIPSVKPRTPPGMKLKRKTNLLLAHEQDIKVMEPYKRLYFYIQSHIFGEQEPSKCILFTSAVPGEGKSLTAANLALVASKAGKKVCLVDANFAKPSVHKLFGIDDRAPGLTDILNKSVTLDAALRDVTDMLLGAMGLQPALQFKGLDRLKLITAGHPIPDAQGLLKSDEMNSFLGALKSRFDCVIFDGSSITARHGSATLAAKCEATFLVYLVGKTAKEKLKAALRYQSDVGGSEKTADSGVAIANMEGVVANQCI